MHAVFRPQAIFVFVCWNKTKALVQTLASKNLVRLCIVAGLRVLEKNIELLISNAPIGNPGHIDNILSSTEKTLVYDIRNTCL
jgi:hypothetical protein